MSLRFIYGRAGAGKSYYCLQEIKSRIALNEKIPLILLVPEDFSFQAEKDLLHTVGERGLIQSRVLSFKRMAYLVFNECGGLTRQHMNNAGKCMLIYRIMDEIGADLKVFTKSVKMQGFVNTLSEIITELKIYGVTPKDIEDAKDKIKDDSILNGKLDDIGKIFSRFESLLHEGYIDSEDDLTILAEKMDNCCLFDGAEIWVDGFTMLTPQQYIVISKLLKKAKRINITLCMYSNGGVHSIDSADIFSGIYKMEDRIINIATDNNISIEKPIKLGGGTCLKFKDNQELAHLERNLYAFPYKVYDKKTEFISIFSAVNKYTEVENIARGIITLCRDENFRFKDIAVVTRDVASYEKLIGAIFSEYKIPYFLDSRRDINSNPLIVLVLSAIEIVSRNWPYEAVFRYLKTGLTGIKREDIDIIENYVLASGTKGKRWTDKKEWTFWPYSGYGSEITEEEKNRLKRINEIRNKICEPFEKLESLFKRSKKSKEVCKEIFEFLCSIKVPESIEDLIQRFKSSGQLDIASEYSKVWNIMIETLDQIVEISGEEEFSAEQFMKILSIGFGEYKIGLIPPSVDQVMFGSVERIKSHNVKALFIIGVNDGIFPSSISDEGILSDRERGSLKALGLEIAPGTKDMLFDEQFLVYTVFTRTIKYLKISYPISDHEGRTMRPSIIISMLKKIFKNINEYSDITFNDTDEENLKLIMGPLSTFNQLVHAMRNIYDGRTVNDIWKEVYSWYMANEKWKDKCNTVLDALNHTNQVQDIEQVKIRELYGKMPRISVTRLEKYAQCPFSYFIQYGLKAKERKIYELSPPDIGSFIHDILNSFSKYLDDNNMTWRELGREECINIISEIVDDKAEKVAAGSIFSSTARLVYLKERLKRVILRAVWLIALHIKRGGFEPKYHEVSFENGSMYPPISIRMSSGEKVSLTGRIDRIDTMENDEGIYVRIVDYKTGNKPFNLSDIYNGLELQLLIYLDAILEYASTKNKKPVIPAGIFYFKIDDPIIKAGGELSADEVEKEIMKNLKMKGLLLSDVSVVKGMDRDISGYSIIIPAMLKGDGTFGANSSVASLEEFEALRKHVKNTIVKLCEDMLKGNIKIKPYSKNKETPCRFCNYRSICRFDISIKENSYRIINDVSKDEIWDTVKNNLQ